MARHAYRDIATAALIGALCAIPRAVFATPAVSTIYPASGAGGS
jgi:hypothetical protein